MPLTASRRRLSARASTWVLALLLGATAAFAEDVPAELRERLAGASAADGRSAFEACASCHSDEKDGEPLVGPGLWGIVGRPVASEPGFDYSDALLAFGGTWTPERLEKLIEDPNSLVPGNTMGFYGVRDPEERIDILAYLLTLHDDDEPESEESESGD